MAEHLANIFGTEKDRVNCPFYFKIGACRHGDRCSRNHNKPSISQTVLLVNMYQNPALNVAPGQQPPSEREVQDHYEDFYEDVFEELAKHGEIKALNICDNLADHLIGNVYAHFRDENDAASALNALNGRYYAGRVIHAEFSPVTDFREATCRQYEEQTCNRGGYCNFMHLKPIGRTLTKELYGRYRRRSRSPDRSRRHRSRSRSPDRGGRRSHRDYDRHRDDRRSHHRDRYDRSSRDRHDRGADDDEERRAKIAMWNKEREEAAAAAAEPAATATTADGLS